MGCGQWFCPSCLREVKGVNYCKRCAGTVGEDYRTLAEELEGDRNSPGIIRSVAVEGEDRWEKGFRSAGMIRVTKRRLRALKRPVDLTGTVAGVPRRVSARLVDDIVAGGAVILAYSLIASFLLLGAAAGNEAMLLGVSALGGLAASVLIRFFCLVAFGGTIGRLMAGIRLVDLRGKLPSPVACFGRALFDTVFDVVMLPHVVSLFLIRPSRKRGSLGDVLVGTQSVRQAEWRAKVQDAIYQEDRAKLLGAAE